MQSANDTNASQQPDNEENASQTPNEQTAGEKKGHGALYAASMGRSATAQVDPHSNSGLANTGTNISYEGATAPGAGGSVGNGYASGKEATGETISTSSDFDEAGMNRTRNNEQQDEAKDTATGDQA